MAVEPPAEQSHDLDSGGFPQELGSRSGCPQSRAPVGRRPDEVEPTRQEAALGPRPAPPPHPPPAQGWTAPLLQEPTCLRTSCSFRQGCKRRRKKPLPKAGWSGKPVLLSPREAFPGHSPAAPRAWLHLAWNFRTFPYLTLARITFVPTQMASPVQTVDGSGWAFHGPIVQKAKLRTPTGPRAKGCAIYCLQPQCLILDLPTTERSPPPRHVHSAVRNTHSPNPLEASRPPQLPGAAVLPATPGGWRPGHPHGLSETQTPVRTGSGVSITARLRGSAQALLPPVAGRMGRSGREGFPGVGLGAWLLCQVLEGLSYFLFSI